MPKKSKKEILIDEEDIGQTDDRLVKAAKDIEEFSFKTLIDQINAEYQLSWWYMKPKMDEWAVRLKLYNNQKRDKEAIGDPLLFTIHQTILASLYEDRLSVEFLGREEGDEETAENLNSLAAYDYDEMGKDEVDYAWDWDASFFGRGLLMALEFDRKKKCLFPEVIDPMTWLRDPRAASVNGDKKGRGAMRFGGREIRLSINEMRKAGIYFDFEKLKPDDTDITSLIDANVQARAEAQGFTDVSKFENIIGENADSRVLEWFTHWRGYKVLVSLGDNRKKIIRKTVLDKDYFPIVDRSIYPISHDWDGVSIPDLVEDKQRARSVLQNLGLAGVKIGLHPTYLYDTNRVKNRGSLNVDFNKHVPVDGDPTGAIQIMQRQTVKNEVSWILDILDTAAQKATATPDIQQGAASQEKRTATELNLVSSKVDTRYSLSAKIFGWSERTFWRYWYNGYKENLVDGIDDKVIRIAGAMGSKWRKLTRENIVANTDPDIKIESKVISETIKFNELQKYRAFIKDVVATDPQNSNIRFALRKIGRLSGFSKDEVEQILPPNVDEMTAETENLKLDAGTRVDVQVYDDDFIHMEIHNRAADTPAKYAHIEAHKKAMMLKRVRPELDMAKNRPQNPEEAAQGVGSSLPIMNNQQTPSVVTAPKL
jgi:hypothetical protein